MSIIGSNWKDEPTDREKYEEITGHEFHGTDEELAKQIDKDIDNGWTSRSERKNLINLRADINREND
jgi:hypothetical protein